MPVNTVHLALKTILDGLILPGDSGILQAYLTPPDPRDDPPPAIYLWSSKGSEKRQSLPRGNYANTVSQAGWKEIQHQVDGYLTWFGEDSDNNADTNFPAALDAIMRALRTSGSSPLYTSDPLTGTQSMLVDIGEIMDYDLVPPRSTASERYLRYDAMITIHVLEVFQA